MRKKYKFNLGSEKYNIINWVIEKNNYQSFLDLGSGVYDHPARHGMIECNHKVSVDVDKKSTYMMRFEDFFKIVDSGKHENIKKFDCIYRDSGYTYHAIKTTLYKSFEMLNENGTIICNFADPRSKIFQRDIVEDEITDKAKYEKRHIPWGLSNWCSQTWKVLVEMQYDKNINADVTIISDSDNIHHGLGVIRKINNIDFLKIKKQIVANFDQNYLNYDFYEKNKTSVVRYVGENEFINDHLSYENSIKSNFEYWNKKLINKSSEIK